MKAFKLVVIIAYFALMIYGLLVCTFAPAVCIAVGHEVTGRDVLVCLFLLMSTLNLLYTGDYAVDKLHGVAHRRTNTPKLSIIQIILMTAMSLGLFTMIVLWIC